MLFRSVLARSFLGSFRSVTPSRALSFGPPEKSESFDCVIIGGGHNGLVAASYIAAQNKKVCVLEKRPVLGGAAVTEEIVPGFKFSRASYLLSLLRPHIISDLELKKHGLKLFLRNPSSYTPLIEPEKNGKSLLIGSDSAQNRAEIAKFSEKDAVNFEKYEEYMSEMVNKMLPLLDYQALPIDQVKDMKGIVKPIKEALKYRKPFEQLNQLKSIENFAEVFTAPTSKFLNYWFESDVVKATLGTDGMIGAMLGPHSPGSSYVLLHHVMGGQEGVPGAWAYVEGGMGGVSKALAKCAIERGVKIFTDAGVKKINFLANNAVGVTLDSGFEIGVKENLLSNATPQVTFENLMDSDDFGKISEKIQRRIKTFNYESPVTKINLAIKELPNFIADPHDQNCSVTAKHGAPHHGTTIHFNCENLDVLHDAYIDSQMGKISRKPMIEMVIPSTKDRSLVLDDKDNSSHVALLFTQFTPFDITSLKLPESRVTSDKDANHAHLTGWTHAAKEMYAKRVFDSIDAYAPNFSQSILGYEVLTPPDLEETFGLTGGNIFHGAMSLDQLYFGRIPVKIPGLSNVFLCGSGAHPGGGVMGSPGYIAAKAVMGKV